MASSSPSPSSSFLYRIPFVRSLQIKLNQLSSYIPPPPELTAGTPKKVLLVHAHPVFDTSFSAAIANTFEEAAKEAGHHVQRINLYDQDDPQKCYRPNLSKEERIGYFNPGRTIDESTLAPEVKTHVDALRGCDSLVFIYPTWWMNTPASLKGFFDRTLIAGICWDFPSKTKAGASLGLVPHLNNIERIVGISTYGASPLIVTAAGDNGRRMISNAIRHSVAPNARVTWLGLYHCDTVQQTEREEFLNQVKELAKQL